MRGALKDFEREFLIRLAPVWLACKLRLQHPARDYQNDPVFTFIGLMDYQAEMSILCCARMRLVTMSGEHFFTSVSASACPSPYKP